MRPGLYVSALAALLAMLALAVTAPAAKAFSESGGHVCFFSGPNYTGSSFCAGPGRVVRDLALLDLDNQFSSVQVIGGVTVAACRDRSFQSYCERIVVSQPVLDPYLNDNLSSFQLQAGFSEKVGPITANPGVDTTTTDPDLPPVAPPVDIP